MAWPCSSCLFVLPADPTLEVEDGVEVTTRDASFLEVVGGECSLAARVAAKRAPLLPPTVLEVDVETDPVPGVGTREPP